MIPKTEALLRSIRTITQKRRALHVMGRRLDAEQRQLMGAMSRVLKRSGYRVVAADEVKTASTRRVRKDLKCPKCARRFAFEMHVARHMNAAHPAKKRVAKRKTA